MRVHDDPSPMYRINGSPLGNQNSENNEDQGLDTNGREN